MSNILRVLFPYQHQGQWVFDDESTGLNKEPFVLGIDTMLDRLSAEAKIEQPGDGIKLLFSHLPFPGATELIWEREEAGGNWYRCPRLDDLEGWLCPALFRYFETAPPRLYGKVEAPQPGIHR